MATPGPRDGAAWPPVYTKEYAGTWFYHMKLCFNKKLTLLLRDKAYIKSQIMSALIMGEAVSLNRASALYVFRRWRHFFASVHDMLRSPDRYHLLFDTVLNGVCCTGVLDVLMEYRSSELLCNHE